MTYISTIIHLIIDIILVPDPDQGQRDGVRERHHVLQGEGRHLSRGQRGRLQRLRSAAGRHHAQVCDSLLLSASSDLIMSETSWEPETSVTSSQRGRP